MIITTFVETLDRLWLYCYTGCILGRAPWTNETLPYFDKNMDPINGIQQCGIGLPEIHKNSAN